MEAGRTTKAIWFFPGEQRHCPWEGRAMALGAASAIITRGCSAVLTYLHMHSSSSTRLHVLSPLSDAHEGACEGDLPKDFLVASLLREGLLPLTCCDAAQRAAVVACFQLPANRGGVMGVTEES